MGRPPTPEEAITTASAWFAVLRTDIDRRFLVDALKVGDVVPPDALARLCHYTFAGLADWASYRAWNSTGSESYALTYVRHNARFFSHWFSPARPTSIHDAIAFIDQWWT